MGYRRRYGSYYGGKSSLPKVRDYKKDISRLAKINDLDIKDLKKIQRFLVSYPEKMKELNSANSHARNENQRIAKINEDRKIAWERENQRLEEVHNRTYIKPIEDQIDALSRELEEYKVSFLSGLVSSQVFESRVLGQTHHFKGARAKEIVHMIETLWERRSAAWHSKPSAPPPTYLDKLPIKKMPNEYTVLTISGLKTRVFFSDFSLEAVEKKIAEREADIAKQEDKVKEIKARADRTESAIRNQAKQYLRGLSSQLKKFNGCPYCSGPLDQSNFHQDHIHPVSKGGFSIPENLVFVCNSCNLKKGNKSLRVFVRDQNLDFNEVSDRLDLLGKH